eukprot:superscaffoldBa00005397_g20284
MVAGKEADEKRASWRRVYIAYKIVGKQEFERRRGSPRGSTWLFLDQTASRTDGPPPSDSTAYRQKAKCAQTVTAPLPWFFMTPSSFIPPLLGWQGYALGNGLREEAEGGWRGKAAGGVIRGSRERNYIQQL